MMPGLPHAAAEQLAGAPGERDGRRIADQHRADRRAESLREAHADRVAGRRDVGERHAAGDVGVPDARPVQVQLEAVPVAERAHGPDALERVHDAAAVVVRVLETHHSRRREVDVVVVVDEPVHGVRVERPVRRVEAAELQLAEHGAAALLVEEDVRLGVQEDLVAALRQGVQRDLVGHRPGGAEERRLLAEQLGRLVLQAVDGRVVLEDVVPDLGLGHGAAHLGAGLRHRVAAHVDHTLHTLATPPARVTGHRPPVDLDGRAAGSSCPSAGATGSPRRASRCRRARGGRSRGSSRR